jgi:signal transduction histidine kinase/ActR/RegA family two-component response regulator
MKQPLRTLSVENDVARAELTQQRLTATAGTDFAVQHATTLSSAEECLSQSEVDNPRLLAELQLANEQLNQKNAHLARINQAAQQFVDNVSHDFRTPLAVIKEFATIIRDGLVGQINSQQQEYLDIISVRVDDLAMMVDDMLDASKLEAGMLCTWRREVTLAEILSQVQRTLQRKAALKNIRIEVEVASQLPPVFCDGEKISRALTNLAVNAIKFSPEGKSVRIWARHQTGQAEVRVGVTDQGPGISLENQAKLFQRFQQLEETSLENNLGCGLGLSIAHELVRLNFGELTVDSELGRGSTFSFTLPLVNPEQFVTRHLQQLQKAMKGVSNLSTLEIRLQPTDTAEMSAVVDEFLQHSLRNGDLVLGVNKRVWLALVHCPPLQLDGLITRLQSQWQKQNRACPLGSLPDLCFEKGPLYNLTENAAVLVSQVMDHYKRLQQPQAGATKLLLVDDDRDIVRGLKVRLQAAGYDVATAHDGVSGYQAALQIRPDAMILDMRMPGMNGLGVMSQLRERPETQNIPVIVLSASLRDQQPALEMGARCFLNKPCDPQTLMAVLQTVASPQAT